MRRFNTLRDVAHKLWPGERSSNGTVGSTISPPPSDDSIAYVMENEAEEKKPRVVITFFGLSGDSVAEMLQTVFDATRQRGEIAVALVTHLDPELISGSPALIEFLPGSSDLPISEEEYELYVNRRWSLILAKWNFSSQIDLGASFEEFVAGEVVKRQQHAIGQSSGARQSCVKGTEPRD